MTTVDAVTLCDGKLIFKYLTHMKGAQEVSRSGKLLACLSSQHLSVW